MPAPTLNPGRILVRNLYSAISPGTESRQTKYENKILKILKSPKRVLALTKNVLNKGVIETYNELKYRKNKLSPIGYSSVGVVLDKASDIKNIRKGDMVACAGYTFANHAEIVSIPKDLFVKVPKNVSPQEAAFAYIGGIALNATKYVNPKKTDNIAVIGLGLIGQIITQILSASGCKVFALDLIKEKAELAKDDNVFTTNLQDKFVDLIKNKTKNGVDKIIIAATSSNDEAIKLAARICCPRGKIVMAGNVLMKLPYAEFLKKELVFCLSNVAGPKPCKTMKQFLDLVAKNKINIKKLILNEFNLNQYNQAFLSLKQNACGVVLKYDNNPEMRTEMELKVSKTNKPNIAVIGLGKFAENVHLPAITSTDYFNLKYVISSSGLRAKDLAKRFKANICSTNINKALTDPEVNLIYITSDDKKHASTAIAAAKANKAIFLEKPLAINEKELKEIISTANNKVFAIGLNRRYSEFAKSIKSEILAHKGPITINWKFNEKLDIDQKYDTSGAIRVCCHFIDLSCWFLDTEIKSVSAFGNKNNFTAKIKLIDGSELNIDYKTIAHRKFREQAEIILYNKTILIKEFADKGYKSQLKSIRKALNGEDIDYADLKVGIRSAKAGFDILKSLKTGKEIIWKRSQ